MSPETGRIFIEVACASVADAVAAEAAGADRIELCSALLVGGLTPSLGVFQAARARVSVPIVCMLRPRPGSFRYDGDEIAAMMRDAAAFRQAGADGLVFGVLTEGGAVSPEPIRHLVDAAGPLETVFHRAFDIVSDHDRAFDVLLESGLTRILTSGGCRGALDGAALIRRLSTRANGRIELLPGGGVRATNANAILDATGAASLHLGPTVAVSDPSGDANRAIDFGEPGGPHGGYRALDAHAVRAVRDAVDQARQGLRQPGA